MRQRSVPNLRPSPRAIIPGGVFTRPRPIADIEVAETVRAHLCACARCAARGPRCQGQTAQSNDWSLGAWPRMRPGEEPRPRLPPIGSSSTRPRSSAGTPKTSCGSGGHGPVRHARQPTTTFQREVRAGTRAVPNHVCHALTEKMLERVRLVPEGGNWRDIPFVLLPAGMQRAKPKDHTKRYGRKLARSYAAEQMRIVQFGADREDRLGRAPAA